MNFQVGWGRFWDTSDCEMPSLTEWQKKEFVRHKDGEMHMQLSPYQIVNGTFVFFRLVHMTATVMILFNFSSYSGCCTRYGVMGVRYHYRHRLHGGFHPKLLPSLLEEHTR